MAGFRKKLSKAIALFAEPAETGPQDETTVPDKAASAGPDTTGPHELTFLTPVQVLHMPTSPTPARPRGSTNQQQHQQQQQQQQSGRGSWSSSSFSALSAWSAFSPYPPAASPGPPSPAPACGTGPHASQHHNHEPSPFVNGYVVVKPPTASPSPDYFVLERHRRQGRRADDPYIPPLEPYWPPLVSHQTAQAVVSSLKKALPPTVAASYRRWKQMRHYSLTIDTLGAAPLPAAAPAPPAASAGPSSPPASSAALLPRSRHGGVLLHCSGTTAAAAALRGEATSKTAGKKKVAPAKTRDVQLQKNGKQRENHAGPTTEPEPEPNPNPAGLLHWLLPANADNSGPPRTAAPLILIIGLPMVGKSAVARELAALYAKEGAAARATTRNSGHEADELMMQLPPSRRNVGYDGMSHSRRTPPPELPSGQAVEEYGVCGGGGSPGGSPGSYGIPDRHRPAVRTLHINEMGASAPDEGEDGWTEAGAETQPSNSGAGPAVCRARCLFQQQMRQRAFVDFVFPEMAAATAVIATDCFYNTEHGAHVAATYRAVAAISRRRLIPVYLVCNADSHARRINLRVHAAQALHQRRAMLLRARAKSVAQRQPVGDAPPSEHHLWEARQAVRRTMAAEHAVAVENDTGHAAAGPQAPQPEVSRNGEPATAPCLPPEPAAGCWFSSSAATYRFPAPVLMQTATTAAAAAPAMALATAMPAATAENSTAADDAIVAEPPSVYSGCLVDSSDLTARETAVIVLDYVRDVLNGALSVELCDDDSQAGGHWTLLSKGELP